MTVSTSLELAPAFVEVVRQRADDTAVARHDDVLNARLVDYAANVAGGGNRQQIQTLSRYATDLHRGDVDLPGGGASAAEIAPLVWGASAHVLEFDDTHQPSSTHPGAAVISAALILAAEIGASLHDLKRSMIAGYEVMCRLGEISEPIREYQRGFHPTGTCGVFGAAASAGVLLGLSDAEFLSAFGIAASFSSGSMSFLTSGAWTKLLHPGNAARSGVSAARLAALGYQGALDPFSPPHGYLARHFPDEADGSPSRLLERTRLAIEETSMKAHGCCRYEQGPIDATLALQREHGFEPAEVERIDVGMLAAGWDITVEPTEAKRRPRSVVESQFSLPFGVALAIVKGSASPTDHNDDALDDPTIQGLADRIDCHRDASLDAEYPAKWPATVEITLMNKSQYQLRVDHPKGDPENPFTPKELERRVRQTAPWSPEGTAEAIYSVCQDKTATARALYEAISACFATTVSTGGR